MTYVQVVTHLRPHQKCHAMNQNQLAKGQFRKFTPFDHVLKCLTGLQESEGYFLESVCITLQFSN